MSDPDGSQATLLFDLEGDEWAPRISPEGDRVLFQNDGEGSFDVYTARLDGTDRKALARTPAFEGVASWSPDGAVIAYYRRPAPESDTPEALRRAWAEAEILTVSAAGGPARELTRNTHRDQSPSWSPDGRTIAWTSCASGNLEVWLMEHDGRNARRLTRTPADDGQ
jgi:TolB protein